MTHLASALLSSLLRLAPCLFAFGAVTLEAPTARAEERPLRVLPVLVEGPGKVPTVIDRNVDAALAPHAAKLSQVLAEAAYDLGFEPVPGDPPSQAAAHPPVYDDEQLIERSRGGWLLSPRIEDLGEKGVRVRLVAVAPGSRVLRVRTEVMAPGLIEVRAVLMLRDLMQESAAPERASPLQSEEVGAYPEVEATYSAGRAVLALNAAVLGGYVGFSLQKASGADDERLIYPLAALGAGLGLGASLLVAEEWNVGVGDAWFVSAGTWWPVAGGLLLAKSYDVEEEDRYIYGIIGASAGVVAATSAIAAHGPMSEGGATIAHSGGVFGMGLGGITELLVLGETDTTPVRGLGYGAITGVVLGGALATQVDPPTSRVLLIDLGASLGALGGAAAASPLLLVEEEPDPTRTRLWLSAVGAGTLVGGAFAYWVTRDMTGPKARLPFTPYAHAIPESRGGTRAELGVLGSF